MELLLIFGFLISLVVLVKSSDLVVEKAEALAQYLGLPSFFIGVTLVSIGTSLPELASSLMAVQHGTPALVGANVVGSNIANTFLILGVSLLMLKKTVKLKWNMLYADITFLVAATFLFTLFTIDRFLAPPEIILLISLYIAYLLFLKNQKRIEQSSAEFHLWDVGLLLIGLVLVYLSADALVSSGIALARLLGVPQSWIGLTAIALGTSLPELSVSAAAARKGNIDMAVANVTGSNLFNLLGVATIPALLNGAIVDNFTTSVFPYLWFSAFMFLLIFLDNRAHKYEGMVAIILYLAFLLEYIL